MRAAFGRRWIGVVLAFLTGVALVSAVYKLPLAQPAFRQANQLMEQQFRYAGWEKAASDHFILSYLPEDEPYAGLVLAEAETVYREFAKQFRFAPQKPVPLVLYAHHEQMQERFGWPASEKASGVYYGGVIYLLSPRVLLPDTGAASPGGRELAEWYHHEGPLVHEYTHLYLDMLANNNFPRWYTEGLAQLVEYEMIGYEWVSLDNRLNQQPLYPFDQLHRDFDKLENVALAYRQSFKWVQFMKQVHGEEALVRFHQQLARQIPFERAWEEVFGQSLERSYDIWLNEVRKGGSA